MTDLDPLLPLIAAGRPLSANNLFRAKTLAQHFIATRGSTEDRMKALVELAVKHFEWAQKEAVARDRATDTVPALENPNG